MPRRYDIAAMLISATILCALPAGAQRISKLTIPATLYNVDIDAAIPSVRILVKFFPLKERNNDENARPCPNARYQPTGPSFRLMTDHAGGFAVRVPAGQYFAVVTSEFFGLVSSCVTVTTPDDARACGVSAPAEARPLQTMIVRYSRKLRFFHGDILMSHPCAPHVPTACDSLHQAYPLVLHSRQIQLRYGGKPLSKTVVNVSKPSKGREQDLFTLSTDSRGVMDAEALYALAGETGTHLLLRIPAGDGRAAEIVVGIPPEPATNQQTLALFQRRKCGWEAEVIP
ncbi:MAG TPA: hypothetical protein VI488_04015 [Candidatus Angelobacter sp.]